MLESTRAKEDAVKKETKEQLDLFRRQQEEADKALLDGAGNDTTVTPATAGSPPPEEGQWAINARKRKRAKEKEVLKGVKLRKSSSTSEQIASLSSESHQQFSTQEAATSQTNLKPVAKEDQAVGMHVDSEAGTNSSPGLEYLVKEASSTAPSAKPTNSGLPGLGLADYSSDDES